MNRFFFININTKLILLAIFTLFLFSCASPALKKGNYNQANQPGSVLQLYLSDNVKAPESIQAKLKAYKGSSNVKKRIKVYTNEIETLYLSGVLELGLPQKKSPPMPDMTNLSIDEATALFALFPIDTAKWMNLVSKHSNLNKNQIYEAAITAGLDPSVVFLASASGFSDSVTPLINSIGLVFYGQDEYSTTSVQFKLASDTEWKKGLDLTWEPIYGAFAGSIVYLEPDTLYDINVTISDPAGNVEEYSFQQKTQTNSPPIDPDKIYYLSEIYSGGQLDLEALNIEGSENGYAKIIGDGQVIQADDEVLSAVNIGSQAYVMLENLTIRGGQRYGIFAKKTHHIWIKGCDIAEYGRVAKDMRNNIAYSSATNNSPINYDSGIYLERSGVAVVEECEVHSPNLGANSWVYGHPKGPNAMQVWAYHPEEQYRGQMIVRNNRFYGTQDRRFNDVIEGRKNFERTGGFVRDSAIYGNYLAYANDDLIEIDGGQQNVLVYDNEMTQGYAGISIAPNMLGPSYIFHNHIYDLGDETGKEWTAIKAGGLIAKPAGRTYIYENFIDVERNAIAASGVNGDATFWVTTQNNIFLTQKTGYSVGYCIFDKEKYIGSSSTNDICYNKNTVDARYEFNWDNIIEHPASDDLSYIEELKSSDEKLLEIEVGFVIPNISVMADMGSLLSPMSPSSVTEELWSLVATEYEHSPFSNQLKYGTTIVEDENTVVLTGNNWTKFEVDFTVTSDTILELELKVEGRPEIVGVGFEDNNSVTGSKVAQFSGKQKWGIDASNYYDASNATVSFPIGEFVQGKIKYLVLILDNDDVSRLKNKDKATFKKLRLYRSVSVKKNYEEVSIKLIK
ncbi:right-handed parallel beta-helix repeat-containing protein [Alteromonas stellipolaris]|uniref:right-handed parallel beta-helix repeat-containing protein n=1 Tax=Alteromonas stellipolaris TaxID=233316 RepID=UPI0026E21B31|nr:right-handed parallel beta-helix repeat-containing protein [Alteromonas stellipolaris]MDO6539761.1 right-handed parallel beta-helix repeat-containing protein [Alteromonas stellipolaris]